MILALSEIPRLVAAQHPELRVVSVDVFDTLLWRLFTPGFVAVSISKRVHRRLKDEGVAMPAVDELIAARRRYFERREMSARADGTEWSIGGWYAELASWYGLDVEYVMAIGLEEELAVEIFTTAPAPHLFKTLELLRGKGLKIAAVSDTQLPQRLLEKLLSAHDIQLDFVISSAGTHLSKRRGNIFEHLAQHFDVEPHQILHVGDHWKSDYIRPLGSGCKAIYLPVRGVMPGASNRRVTLNRPTERRVHEIWRALRAPDCDEDHTLYRLGFDSLAPLLAIISLWHWQQFEAHRLQTVLYLARDARLLFDAHQLLRDLFPSPPDCHYVQLSRRCVSLAHPGDLLQHVADLGGKAVRSRVADFFSQFNLPDDLERRILCKSGVSHADRLTQSTRRALEQGIHAHSDNIVKVQHRQRALVQQYIKQFADGDCRRLGIVDLGWAGTIQDAVRASMDAELDLVGLYLGLSDQGLSPKQNNQKYGLVRDDYHDRGQGSVFDRTAGVVRLWELMLTEQGPTTRGLHLTESGRIQPIYAENLQRCIDQRTSLEELHRGAIDGLRARRAGVSALIQVSADWPEEVWQAAASLACRPITSRPKRADARALLAIDYEDNSVSSESRRYTLDINGMRTGLSWYPGILAKYGFGWLQGPLEVAAEHLARKYSCTPPMALTTPSQPPKNY